MRRIDFWIGAGLVIFCLLFFSFRTAELGYSVPDEKRYIQSTKEMVEGGDWITPYYHGRKRFEKPVLFYWLTALSSRLWGLNLYGYRFPSILFGSLTVLAVYLLGLEFFERGAGLISAFFLATSGMFYAYSRFATPDITFIFFLTISIYFFIKGCKMPDSRHPYFIFFFASAGLATLTKGPVGAVLIILMALTVSFGKVSRIIKKMRIGTGVLVFLALVLPWFLVMIKIHGSEYLNHVWGVEIMQRLTGGGRTSGLIKDFSRYVLVIILAFLPVTMFLPSSIIETARPSGTEKKRERALLLGWLVLIFLFFTFFGTKKAHYMLAASPALALLIGGTVFYRRDGIWKSPLFKLPLLVVICVYVLGLAGLLLLMNYMLGSVSMIYYFVALVPLILIWGWTKKKSFPVVFISSSVVLILFFMGAALPVLDNQPLLKFAGIIEPEFKEGNMVGVGSHVISHNRLSRYLGRKVKKVNADLADPDMHVLRNRQLLLEFLAREEKVFCVVTEEDYLKYVPQSIRKNLYILGREKKWKKTNKIDFDRKLALYFLSGKKDLFMDRVREEILLLSNKGVR